MLFIFIYINVCLKEHSENLSTSVFLTRFLMVKDSMRCGKHNVAKLPRWEQFCLVILEIFELDIESRANRDTLVQASEEVNDNFAAAVIVDNLEFADISSLHHNLEKLDNDLAARTDKDLALSTAFGISDRLESVCENRGSDHSKRPATLATAGDGSSTFCIKNLICVLPILN